MAVTLASEFEALVERCKALGSPARVSQPNQRDDSGSQEHNGVTSSLAILEVEYPFAVISPTKTTSEATYTNERF